MGRDPHERFLELFLRCQQDLRAFCYSVLRDWHRCDDAVQEVALVLWRRFDDYDPARPFGAWARGVASRTLMNQSRRHRRQPRPVDPATIAALAEAFDAVEAEDHGISEAQDALERCLQSLGERPRRLLHLRYHDDLGMEAIADAVGGSVAAVKKAMSRLRQSLGDCVSRRLGRVEERT